MTLHTIDIQIEEPYRSKAEPETLRRAAGVTLRHQGIDEPCELAVAVTGDDTLHELNRRHRGVDAPTDVLAFPHETKSPASAPFVFVDAPGFPRYLGDVVISFPRAKAQAAEAGNTLPGELQLLVVHGVLHLLGYDDQTGRERARMWRAQKAVLDEMGVEVHLPD
jgi:probable rRNA maturation factor